MRGCFVQTALDKISSKILPKSSNMYQNSYKYLDPRSHLNLLSFKYIYMNLSDV